MIELTTDLEKEINKAERSCITDVNKILKSNVSDHLKIDAIRQTVVHHAGQRSAMLRPQ